MSNIDTMDLIELEDKKVRSIELPLTDLLCEWEDLIEELSEKEIELTYLKQKIFEKEQIVINETDFKAVYGKNNADVRKQHFNKFLKDEYAIRNHLEVSIDYLKRRISFLKQLIHTKTIIMEVKA